MEDKIIKEIKTSCPFPLLIYKTNIKYNEVRKASGIAYILLELIDKSSKSTEKISDVLLKFGIPADLHYIFGKELAGLISTDIISSKFKAEYFTNPRYFSQMKIGEISLTEKGKKMFREGAIPTGQEKVKAKDIFFDPVRRKFDIASSLPFSDISTSALGEEFIDRLDLDISGMEDYINANPTKMGLKAEERIVSFEPEEPQRKAAKPDENLTIIIRQSGVEFKFATSDENAFFNKYFSSALMKDVMLIKTKYRFTDSAKNIVAVPTVRFENLNAENLYIPEEFSKQVGRPCKVFISRNTFGYDGVNNAIKVERNVSAKLLSEIDGNAEFALLDSAGCRYYRAVNVAIPCGQFNDVFEIQLLAENQASDEQFKQIVQSVFDLYKAKPFDEENGRAIAYAVEVLHSGGLFEEYVTEKLMEVKTPDDKISVLLKLNSSFAKVKEWQACFTHFAEELYSQSVKEIKLDNMIYKNTVLSPLKQAMGMSDIDYITSFSQGVKQSEDPTLVYQALSAAGFTTTEIFGVVNVVEIYMRAILDDTGISADNDLAAKYGVIQTNLRKLNDMLGIESLSAYTIKDDYNVDEFFNAYGTFTAACQAVEKYRQYATIEYDELKRYTEIYKPIHELLSIERTSASHPEKITEEYIDGQISRGRYKDAICDLLIKAQYDLRKLLNADNTTPANELIDEAKNDGYIDGKQANALHKLRVCRNGLQHPERTQTVFDEKTITEWKEIVLSIDGGKK